MAQPRLWKHPPFVILISGQWISQVGNALFLMGVSWFILSSTHNRTDLGYVLGIAGIAGLMGIVSGVFADRWNHRRTLVFTDLIRAVLSLGLVALLSFHDLHLIVLAVILFLLNLLETLFNATEMAYLPEVTGKDLYPAANSVNQSSSALSQLVGLGTGGWLLTLGGPVLLFLLNGISFFISALSLFMTRPETMPVQNTASHRRIREDLTEGLSIIVDSAFLRRIIPLVVAINFVLTPLSIMDVAWVRQILHQGAVAYGFFSVAILVGIIVGSLMSPVVQKQWAMSKTIIGSFLILGTAFVSITLYPHLWANIICLVIAGTALGTINTLLSTQIVLMTAADVRGRIGGIVAAGMSMATPLGEILVGWVSGMLGLNWLFRFAGFVIMALSSGFIGLPLPKPLQMEPSSEEVSSP
ncbi:MFS transporter [Sulfobacillus thermosulfidooxidans]|uniref:MFS transporter n=1 Tax=Sulfobacillus thermosulfidooxidans TaxID=28034 RepID=UPI0006B5B117|nr:MFS transporter [Sulfobacillus thermosulfidooxidans]